VAHLSLILYQLDIDIKDCKIVHISHRIAPDRAYFDFYVKVISILPLLLF